MNGHKRNRKPGNPEDLRRAKLKWREKCAAEGLCLDCGLPRDLLDNKNCLKCKTRKLEAVRKRNAKWRADGLCPSCGGNSVNIHMRGCEDCWFKAAAKRWSKGNWLELKDLWYAQGGRCAYSGCLLTFGVNAELDHKTSRKNSGDGEISNLHFVDSWVNTVKGGLNHADFLLKVPQLIELLGKIVKKHGDELDSTG